MKRYVALFLFTVASLFAATPANTADLKVLGAGPVERPFKTLMPGFSKETGHTADGTFDTVGVILAKLKKGEKADIIILSPVGMDELEKAGGLVAGTRIEVGRAANGLGVRAGAPLPDISTPDAVKQTLLAAKTIGYVDPAVGASNGIFFASVIKKLGIADEVNKKATLFTRGHHVATALAEGKVEIGNTSLTELAADKGVRVVGPLPKGIDLFTPYVAAVASASPHADAARALIAYLMRPASREQFKADGL